MNFGVDAIVLSRIGHRLQSQSVDFLGNIVDAKGSVINLKHEVIQALHPYAPTLIMHGSVSHPLAHTSQKKVQCELPLKY